MRDGKHISYDQARRVFAATVSYCRRFSNARLRNALLILAVIASPLTALAEDAEAIGSFNPELFVKHVQPMLKRYCAHCHDGADAEGGINLHLYRSADDVLNHRAEWRKVLKQLKAGAMPPDGEERPGNAERTAVVAWLEQALVYIDLSKPVDPGRVTARRLNRAEYNNTIRDLFGVHLKLADEFPADDVGYGFDNIGDVLSVSPLRMEQYLAAAERLTDVLLGKTTEPPLDEYCEAVFFKFNQKPRNPSDRGWELTPQTEIYLDFHFPAPGEYSITIHAWGVEQPQAQDRETNERWLEAPYNTDPDAPAPVEATLLCNDDLIGHVPVKPGNATSAIKQTYTLRFTTQAGEHTIRIRHRFPRDMSDEQIAAHMEQPLLAPRLGMRRVSLRGPLRVADAKLAPAHDALLNIRPNSELAPRAAAATILRTIADRAFRRPVSDAELNELVDYVTSRMHDGADFEQAIELGVHAILVSPRFLFRIERNPTPHDPDHIAPLDDYALASRLSYFLWASTPDDTLLDLAAHKRLHAPDVLAAQIERMLADPRSGAFVEGFFGQWLELQKLMEVNVDRELYEAFSTELKDDLRTETTLFVESIVRENRSVLDLLTADFSFINGRLAKFYGIKGVVKDADFQRVSLAGTPRRGLLTHGGILMLTSYPNRTSPTRRGNWILETILGEEPPPPPQNVPELEQTQSASPDLPLREQLKLHTVNPTCVSCHRTMDAIGFGFEHFDAIGQWRDDDRGKQIDASGDLPSGETFTGAVELIEHLARREEAFVRHVAAKMLTFALGRGVEYYDRVAIDRIVEQTRGERYRFQDIIRQVVLSRPFRLQRGDAKETRP
jgi:hypothetical protein